MTMTLTYVTTGSALAHAIADSTRDDEASAIRAWVAGQLRFERLLRTLEQESDDGSTNPSSDAE
jgi:hypothetical protein